MELNSCFLFSWFSLFIDILHLGEGKKKPQVLLTQLHDDWVDLVNALPDKKCRKMYAMRRLELLDLVDSLIDDDMAKRNQVSNKSAMFCRRF